MKKIFIILFLILLFSFFGSLYLGAFPLHLKDIYKIIEVHFGFLNPSSSEANHLDLVESILINIRFPRILAAALIGASYALSGSSLQAIFSNPLVSPGILGVLAGSAFGAVFGISFFNSWILTQAFSFIFGILAVCFGVFIAYVYNSKASNKLILILGGIISGSFFSTLVSILKYTADPYNQLPSIVYWLLGSLASIDLGNILELSPLFLLGIFGLIFLAKYLNILSFGDKEAKSLGINANLIRVLVIIFATLVSSLSVALGGMIGWIGLIIPHFTRLLVGSDNTKVLPASGLLGASFLIIVDDFSRLLFKTEIPIGILSSLIGIPIFIFALKNAKKV